MIEEIRRRGGYAITIAPPVEAGTPDVIACIHGRFVGIECKNERGKTSRIQDHRMGQIRSAGGTASVIRSRDGLRDLLSLLASSRHSVGLGESSESGT